MKKILETLKQKWAEYLLEIMVIIVGILGAFALDNWNSYRQDRKVEQELLVNLKADLIRNNELLFNDLISVDRSINSIEILLEILQNNTAYHDSLNIHFHRVRVFGNPGVSNSSYEEIKYKGFELIVSRSLRKNIVDLYEVSLADMTTILTRVQAQSAPFVREFLYINFENTCNTCLVPNDFNSLKNDQVYRNILTQRLNLLSMSKSLKKKSIAKIERVLDLIDTELN
jgi:hypothetical protein